ncbi:MAG: hypothetical protein LBV19_03665 [Streptococcaceae bacterium]|nr:hypothetical protein [Streptococcaceae bacterium]
MKTLTRSLLHLILGVTSGSILYLAATNTVNFFLAQGNFTEHSFIIKYFSISDYFFKDFLRNLVMSYLVCLIYYAAYWIFKYLDFRLSKKPMFKDFSWDTKKFFVDLILPSLLLGIMLSLQEEDLMKFLFPVTLFLAANNTRMLFLTKSAAKKQQPVEESVTRKHPPRKKRRVTTAIRRSSLQNKR